MNQAKTDRAWACLCALSTLSLLRYIVHPSALLRSWLLAFQLRIDPELFRRVVYVGSLLELQRHLGQGALRDLPQHVRDEDARKTAKR